ncbi:MAG: S8 family serine peptidase [Candidatus Binatia bacterium]|nr:S8 family serine peptidase [Candidatus Binatia bacterium]
MRLIGVLPAGVVATLLFVTSALGAGAAGLMDRAQRDGTVRVLARLPVAAAPVAMRGTAAGDQARRVAIRSARARLEGDLGDDTAWEVTRSFDNIPYVALEIGAEALARLQLTDKASGIVEDRLETILLEESRPIVQADQADSAGFDGSGWAVAVVDTGVDTTHTFLKNKVVSEACFSMEASCANGQIEQFGAGSARPCDFADSACSHGTHVAGVVAGAGETIDGVARGANVIAIQVFSRFTGTTCDDDNEDPCAKTFTSDTIKALDHVYGLRNDFKIAAVNMSLGGGQHSSVAACDLEDSARKEIIDQLRSVGIATVVAAGNESRTDALTSPACVSSAISVGATNDNDGVAAFSNSAPFLDLLAPGVQIFSSVPGGGATISGTSQATPHVAAAFAVLNQRIGTGDVDRVLGALKSTGVPVFDGRNSITTPRIRILDAANSLPGGVATSSGLQITPDGKHTLVSKDVGSERWAITLNADDGSVTGNVFKSDGSEPSFVWCEYLFDDGNADQYEREVTFECSGADACSGRSCPADEWRRLATVSLPQAFFLPPLTAAGVTSTLTGPTPFSTETPSGLQITPDQKRTLVSKDVGDDRWAITLNDDDSSVTGNVFTPGKEPTFLWCEFKSDNGVADPANVLLTYACSVADRCDVAPCDSSQWNFLQDVIVPGWFFQP